MDNTAITASRGTDRTVLSISISINLNPCLHWSQGLTLMTTTNALALRQPQSGRLLPIP